MISRLAKVSRLVTQVFLYLLALQTLCFLTFLNWLQYITAYFFVRMHSSFFLVCLSITAIITDIHVIFLLCVVLGKILWERTRKIKPSYISIFTLELTCCYKFLFDVLDVRWCIWLHALFTKLMEGKSAVKFLYFKKTSFGVITCFLLE
jgi:hypothetical protein